MDSLFRRFCSRVVPILIGMLCLAPAASQAQQEAGILGQVTDESGAVLPASP